MVPDSAYYQRRVGEEVEPLGGFGGVSGGDRVLQARGELAGRYSAVASSMSSVARSASLAPAASAAASAVAR